MATIESYPFYPGQAAVGWRVEGSPSAFTQLLQKQGGVRSWNPGITAPGTIASAGTVWNSTGVDCNVYLSAASGITSVKVLASQLAGAVSYTPPGSVPSAQGITVEVPGPGGLAVTYAGALSWVWQPA